VGPGNLEDPYDFDCELGEAVIIAVTPVGVGDTFVVSKPATPKAGKSKKTSQFTFTITRPQGTAQVIEMLFHFPTPIAPGSMNPQNWPRFEIEVKGSGGGTYDVPAVFQSSIATAFSEKIVDLVFQTR
jgi:hypothetical protein